MLHVVQIGLSGIEVVLILSTVVTSIAIEEEAVIFHHKLIRVNFYHLLFLNDLGHLMVEGHLHIHVA